MSDKSKQVMPGQIPTMVACLAQTFKFDPKYAMAVLQANFPKMNDRETCPNCGESMFAYIYSPDFIDAATIIHLGNKLQENMRGKLFTEANKFKITSDHALSDAQRHRTSKLRFLGLLAKVKNAEGKHDGAQWLITKRGFEFLAGHQVPAHVKVWRNKIEERTEETTNIDRVLATKQMFSTTKVEEFDKSVFYQQAVHGGAML